MLFWQHILKPQAPPSVHTPLRVCARVFVCRAE